MSPGNRVQYQELIDKLTLFLCSLAMSVLLFPEKQQVLPFLLAFIFIALFAYLDPGPLRRLMLAVFSLLCLFLPPLTLYLPASVHEQLDSEPRWVLAILLPPLAMLPLFTGWIPFLILLPNLILSLLLKKRSSALERQQKQTHQLQDRLRETRLKLANLEQIQVLEQETQVRLATLHERNRIARDIHDNVGHLLSSSLLQTAALLAGPLSDETQTSLTRLKDTLAEGLSCIRKSVHQLHEAPVDLETEIGRLLQAVSHCVCRQSIELLGIPDQAVRQCILSVTREALSNVIRHSNATELTLTLKEHPAFYQLAIADNGQGSPVDSGEGMGLNGIQERVSLLGGRLHISRGKGFTLFITLPKG